MEDLLTESRRVGSLPTVFYVPEYVSPAEEAQLLTQVRSSKAKWTQVSGRRLQNYGGVVHAKGCLIQQALPSWLDRLTQRIHRSAGVYGEAPPNHVLVNSYQPGQGIMPHEDGPLYHPGVCILSLGAPAVLHFTRKRRGGRGDGGEGQGQDSGGCVGPSEVSVACMPRSLVVFRDEAYTDCLHGIHEVEEEAIGDLVANREAAGLLPMPPPPGQIGAAAAPAAAAAAAAADDDDDDGDDDDDDDDGDDDDDEEEDGDDDGDGGAAAAAQVLPRGGERISLTVRRVLRVQKNLLMRL